MLNIILTSYNRPALLRRTLTSLIEQTSKNWTCYLQDDGSNAETLAVIKEFTDPRVIVKTHKVTDSKRQNSTRYSVLINELLLTLWDGVVGYLCDNVEYHPRLVETVNAWFEANPEAYSGYVYHLRDVWAADGSERLGAASDFGHWDLLPPGAGAVDAPDGLLDHSQVFHRLPCGLLWNESSAVKTRGDGDFFTRLVKSHGSIHPIDAAHILTTEHLLEGKV